MDPFARAQQLVALWAAAFQPAGTPPAMSLMVIGDVSRVSFWDETWDAPTIDAALDAAEAWLSDHVQAKRDKLTKQLAATQASLDAVTAAIATRTATLAAAQAGKVVSNGP